MIEVVAGFEALRQRLTNIKGMDVVIAFNSLDFDNDGKISTKDVIKSAYPDTITILDQKSLRYLCSEDVQSADRLFGEKI